MVERDALDSELVDQLSAWHQHLIDESLNVRECPTR
jgi:hypothetical protein